jgi:putative ABC transport system permease protein
MLLHLYYAFRRIARSPADTAVVLLSLCVGMAAVATMLGVVDTLFFRPPAGVRDPARVVGVGPWANRQRTTYPDYMDLRSDSTALEAVGAFAIWDYTVRIGTAVVPARGMLATSTLLPLMGIEPVSGRSFSASEDRPGAEPAILVSRAFWRRTVGTDEVPLGRTVRVADRSYIVIGVLRENVTAPDLSPIDVVLPITNAPWFGGAQALQSRAYRWLRIVGRLRDGVTVERAGEEATGIYRHANQGERAVDQAALTHVIIPVRPIVLARHEPDAPVTRVLLWITILATALLLIACANVASILLARGVHERHAFAIRAALGASGWRLFSQVFAEVIILVGISAVFASVLAHAAGVAFTAQFLAASVPAPPFDTRTLLIVTGVAFVTMVVCALAPAVRALRSDPRAELATGSPTTTRPHRFLFRGLLIAQTCLCFVLVAEAILFGTSLRQATRVDLGVELEHLLIGEVDLHAAGLVGAEAVTAARRTIQRVTSIPGVVAAGITDAAAIPGFLTVEFTVPGGVSVSETPVVEAVNGVTPGYLEALGIHPVIGRTITDMDAQGGRHVMLVSQGFARRYWPQGSALERCVKMGGPTTPCSQVVGVVNDRRGGPGDTRADVEAYVPLGSPLIPRTVADLYPGREIAVRVTGDPAQALAAVRSALLDVVPQLTSVRVRTGPEYLERQFRGWRLGAGVLSAFGLLALALAGVGVFGVSSCVVAQRVREFSIRCALGATRTDLAALVLSEAASVGATGVALGVVVALGAAHAVRALAFGVSPMDPRIYGVVAVVLLAMSLFAAALPALRAAGADPTKALRSE